MTLYCGHCLLAGQRLPTKVDHVGLFTYAKISVTVIDGNALCVDHAKRAVATNKKKVR